MQLLVSVTLFVAIIGSCDGSTTEQPKKLVGNLLVVCDKAFSDRFQQNRQQIIEYWASYMWDINLRFKTLPSVDLTFKISHLVVVNNPSDQPFIEEARNSNGSLVWLQSLYKFAEWVYIHETNFTNFDIAVLATGDKVEETSISYTYTNGACRKDDDEKRHQSVVLFHFDFPWGNFCGVLERVLGLLLGASYDKNTGLYDGCRGRGFVMDQDNQCQGKQYFFSKCSDKGIADNLKLSTASCLHTSDGTENDVIAASSLNSHPPSLRDQCVLLTNNNSATVELGGNPCLVAKCYVGENENKIFSKNLHPVDNSPCGSNKFCFRGRCLPYSYQIQNVGNGKCLHSSDRFSSSDPVILENCVTSPTPLDKFRVLGSRQQGIFLATPYSTLVFHENDDKCLSVDLFVDNLEYRKCSFREKELIGWDLIEVDERQGEFLLFNHFTHGCARASEDFNSVHLSRSCDESDKLMRWKFHDLDPPKYILKSQRETISNSSTRVDTSTMSLPGPLQYNSQKSSTSSFSVGLICLVFGIVICCASIYVLKRYGKWPVYRNSGRPASTLENQDEPLYTTENGFNTL